MWSPPAAAAPASPSSLARTPNCFIPAPAGIFVCGGPNDYPCSGCTLEGRGIRTRGGIDMDIGQRLDAAVGKAIAENRIVVAVLLVRRDGRLIYETAQGLADREAGRAMSVDMIFRLSSLTKPIVAATILALVDD